MSTASPSERSIRSELNGEERAGLEALRLRGETARSWAEFSEGLLAESVATLDATGGVLWMITGPQQMAIQRQANIDLMELLASETSRQEHQQLLGHLIASGQTCALSPQRKAAGETPVGNPTDFTILCGVLRTTNGPVGLLEFFLSTDDELRVRQGVRFLQAVCELAARFFAQHLQQDLITRQTLLTQIEEFSQVVHHGLDLGDVCFALANEGRRLIGCTRVSVATWDGRRCKLRAISGQDTFDKRANVVRLMATLATTAARGGEPLWFTGDATQLPPQVEHDVQAYVDESHASLVAIWPMLRPVRDEKVDRPDLLGLLIVEELQQVPPEPVLRERADLVIRHGSRALANALDHEALFLMPLWRTLGKTKWVVQSRRLSWTMLIGGTIVAVLLALFLIRVDFEVESKGSLEPVVKRDAYAPFDGLVRHVEVEHGASVAAGAPLVILENSELEVELSNAEGRLRETIEQLLSFDRMRSNTQLKADEVSRLSSQAIEKQATRRSLEQQIALLKRKQEQSTIASPIAGQVVTWQVQDRLMNRPVQRGQSLLTVADLSSAWELELHVPENHVGFLTTAQHDIASDLPIRFYLASRPTVVHTGKIRSVHTTADIHGEDGNTVLVRVQIDPAELMPEELRPGVTATAKIHCGRSSLFYAWFHDALGWVHRTWFKF